MHQLKLIFTFILIAVFWHGPVCAQLATLDSFNLGIGTVVSLTYDNGLVWVYGDFDADIRAYAPDGTFVTSIPRPGGAANDVDLDVLSEALTIDTTLVAAGALLYFDGESGETEIYAVDPVTGDVLASLATAFGNSHVVGGAYHAGRNTFFLLQDRQPAAADRNRVAEIDPVSGAVLNTFQVTTALPSYSVNYGDLDIETATGNLYVVSSDESATALFTPDGGFVCELALPSGVAGLSGVGFDDSANETWVSSTNGTVYRLQVVDLDGDSIQACADNCTAIANPLQIDTNGDSIGNVCDPDIASVAGVGIDDCIVNFSDLNALKQSFFATTGNPAYNPDADLTGPAGTPDGAINFADLNVMKAYFFGTPGPSAAGCD